MAADTTNNPPQPCTLAGLRLKLSPEGEGFNPPNVGQ
jgi:hypothetical protein